MDIVKALKINPLKEPCFYCGKTAYLKTQTDNPICFDCGDEDDNECAVFVFDEKTLENHIKRTAKPLEPYIKCSFCKEWAINMMGWNFKTNSREYGCIKHFKL